MLFSDLMKLQNTTLTASKIASIYATDQYAPAKARDSFVRAGDWYKQEDANACVIMMSTCDCYSFVLARLINATNRLRRFPENLAITNEPWTCIAPWLTGLCPAHSPSTR
jgi:hypothetical protein